MPRLRPTGACPILNHFDGDGTAAAMKDGAPAPPQPQTPMGTDDRRTTK